MNFSLIVVGKTNSSYIQEGEKEYIKRIKKYTNFNYTEVPVLKNASKLSEQELKKKEGELLLKKISKESYIVLLDENGREMGSVEFADKVNNYQIRNIRDLCFIVGGAYGFSEDVYRRANEKLSLSRMTFSHQIIRMFFLEQLYRAFTIIKGEPYHHK